MNSIDFNLINFQQIAPNTSVEANEIAMGMLSEQSQRNLQLFPNPEDSENMRPNVVAESLLIAAIASSHEGNKAKEDSKNESFDKTSGDQIDHLVMDFAHKLEAFCITDSTSGENWFLFYFINF